MAIFNNHNRAVHKASSDKHRKYKMYKIFIPELKVLVNLHPEKIYSAMACSLSEVFILKIFHIVRCFKGILL